LIEKDKMLVKNQAKVLMMRNTVALYYPKVTQASLHSPDIAVHFARILFQRAIELGMSQDILLSAVELTPVQLRSPHRRISAAQLGNLFRVVMTTLDDELLGFGAAPHRYGGFALMARQMVSCATLGEALRYSEDFTRLTSPALRWQMHIDKLVRLDLQLVDYEADSQHFLEEYCLLAWHRFSNWLIGERVPLVHTAFRFEPPAHSAEYRIMFPGLTTYGHKLSSIRFDAKWLQAPVTRTQSELHNYLQRLPYEWFSKQIFEGNVSDRVKRAFASSDDGMPTLEKLALYGGVSTRTLHRKLQEEGTSYRKLREDFRRERASALLLDGTKKVRDIARQLGMTEPAFSRAFKHWTGVSPLAFRRSRS
jgi:AraC-like DNA-binding protein